MHVSKTVCEYFVVNLMYVDVVLCYFQVYFALVADGLGVTTYILNCASVSTTISLSTMTPSTTERHIPYCGTVVGHFESYP